MKNDISIIGVGHTLYQNLKLLLGVLFLISSMVVFGQKLNSAQAQIYEIIENETPKRGVYAFYSDFLNNKPSIIDSFYVNESPRSQPVWQGTNSVKPRYANKNRKVKKVWGFSDGKQAYILNELEFFPIVTEENKLVFYGYDRVDNSGAVAAGAIGGAIGGGIAASAALSKAKSEKIRYTIHPTNGTAVHPKGALNNSLNASVEIMNELIIYRRSRKESEDEAKFVVNGKELYSFEQKSYVLLEYPLSIGSATLCTGSDFKDCIIVALNHEEPTYVECTYPIDSETPQLILQEESQGEFDYFKIENIQDKRGVQVPTVID